MADTYHFSAPGRTEIGGNHTDHQHGCVLAAAVDMETTAEVTLTGTNIIRVDSEGYKPVEIDMNDLDARESEKNTTAALIRGVAAGVGRGGGGGRRAAPHRPRRGTAPAPHRHGAGA